MRLHPALLTLALTILVVPSHARLHAQSDRETVESMQHKASLACPGYSTDRANPAIAKISVDALRVLIAHNVTLCPDRRIQAPQAVIWYPSAGALDWNPEDPAAVSALALIADRLTRKEDFPQGATVYDAKGGELKNQIVPEFHFKDTYRR